MIQLGDTVEDKVSGYIGIVAFKLEALTGEIDFGIQASVADNPTEYPNSVYYVNEKRLKIIKKNHLKEV